MAEKFKITYSTLSADNPQMHKDYEEGIETAKSWFGKDHPFYVDGEARTSDRIEEERSPIDNDILIGRFSTASEADVDDAVRAARKTFEEWSALPWQERVEIMSRAAELISDRIYELSALVAIEVGKNRLEALGDVEESADLIRYYCDQMEANDGFAHQMGQLSANEHTRSVLRPYGVWAVISPFNFPMALAAGPAGGALVAGNTVVFKPSPQGSFTGVKLYECLRDAGLPAGAFHYLPGGDEIGAAVASHPGVDGITFTGSYQVGMQIYERFASGYPRPAVCEMGGKNPTIVSAKADLDLAADGVMRSAFGFTGQKCSACSRVYVERPVADEFVAKLADRAAKIEVGDPVERDVYMGPVIDRDAVERFREAVAEARRDGTVAAGGEVLERGQVPPGNYVAPTVVTGLPADHRLLADELFVPFVAVHPVDSLDEGLELANDTEYGLTAGFYSADQDEVERFLAEIQAGVVYVNRRAGATTGAWPGVQPFGGWKGSGSSGKAGGGLYYVQQFMREQSQTVVA
jgi:1-pyrroline-5-carboxylate dehydrogenase